MTDGVPNHIRALFEHHRLRCTRQRQVLYEALAATKCHPTADELFQMVNSREAGLSLATVYNTLEAFSEVGLVRRIPCAMGSGACRFDADTHDHVHVALPDGRIEDVPEDLSGQFLAGIPATAVEDLEKRLGVRVGGLTIQIVVRPEGAETLSRAGIPGQVDRRLNRERSRVDNRFHEQGQSTPI